MANGTMKNPSGVWETVNETSFSDGKFTLLKNGTLKLAYAKWQGNNVGATNHDVTFSLIPVLSNNLAPFYNGGHMEIVGDGVHIRPTANAIWTAGSLMFPIIS